MRTLLSRVMVALALAVPAQAQPPAAAEPMYPRIDPARLLEGPALVAALRQGGLVLYMRHARQAVPQPQGCTQANLTAEGVAQAASVGSALRRLAIRVGTVHASHLCRASLTARLLDVGEVRETADLNPSVEPAIQAARRKRMADLPPAGTNTLLVSHVQGAERPEERMQLELGEIVAYRPDGKGGSQPVARIRVEDWDALR